MFNRALMRVMCAHATLHAWEKQLADVQRVDVF